MSERAGIPARVGGRSRLDARWSAPLLLVAVVVLVAVLPVVMNSDYRLYLATQVGIYLLVAMGLNLLSGYAGQPSLCHGALLAVGAYVTALATTDHGWSFWPAALAGMGLTAAAGALIALPAFRVSAWYFALITLAFADVVGGMLVEWGGLTHSFAGVVGIPMPSLLGHDLSSAQLFWLVAAVDIVCFLMIANLIRGRFGRGFMALRDNDAAARASGISLVGLKMFAFVVSAAITGLAGAFYAVQKTVITPDDFTPDVSIFFLRGRRAGWQRPAVGPGDRHAGLLRGARTADQPAIMAPADLRRRAAGAHAVRAAGAGGRHPVSLAQVARRLCRVARRDCSGPDRRPGRRSRARVPAWRSRSAAW